MGSLETIIFLGTKIRHFVPTKIRKIKGYILKTISVNLIVNYCQFMDSFVFAQKNAACCIGGRQQRCFQFRGKD